MMMGRMEVRLLANQSRRGTANGIGTVISGAIRRPLGLGASGGGGTVTSWNATSRGCHWLLASWLRLSAIVVVAIRTLLHITIQGADLGLYLFVQLRVDLLEAGKDKESGKNIYKFI